MTIRYALDANLLVLYVVGSFDRDLIVKHKRCRDFDEIDFDLLVSQLNGAAEVASTPHCLAEASNLIRFVGEPARSMLTRHFGRVIERTSEIFIRSAVAAMHPAYERLGLADGTLLSLGASGAHLMTVDFDLYITAARSGLQTTNFHHLREAIAPRG